MTDKEIQDGGKEVKHSDEEETLGGPQFLPRLFLQRYYFVQQTLSKLKAEQVTFDMLFGV